MCTKIGFNYRTEVGRYNHIDVMRGVAVSLVVLNHLSIDIFHLGFLGVDIFFVISGFVIFNLVLNQRDQGLTFSVKNFLLSRVKRLFPPFIITTIIVITVSPFILSSENAYDTAVSSIYSIANISNFYFMFTTHYFGPESIDKPFLHFWSLSVEEQFYLIFPLAVLGYIKFRKIFVVTALALFTSSLLFFVISQSNTVAVNIGPDSTAVPIENVGFYMMPSRAFEFLVGIFVCIAARARNFKNLIHPRIIIYLVISTVIVLPFLGITNWLGNLAVVALTAFFLLTCISFGNEENVSKDLGWLHSLGRSSYSIYLAHWPIIVFVAIFLEGIEFLLVSLCLTLLVGYLLAWSTERKLSLLLRGMTSRKQFLYFMVACVATTTIASTLILTKGRIDPSQPVLARTTNYLDFQISPENKTGTALLVGESHSSHFLPAFAEIYNERRIAVEGFSGSGCLPVVGMQVFEVTFDIAQPLNPSCEIYHNALLERIAQGDVEVFALAARWMSYVYDPRYVIGNKNTTGQRLRFSSKNEKIEFSLANLKTGLLEQQKKFTRWPERTIILGQVPPLGLDIIDCLNRSQILISTDCKPKLNRSQIYEKEYPLAKFFEEVVSVSDYNHYHSMFEEFCSDGAEHCITFFNEKPLYRDDNHLSVEGSLYLGNRLIRRNFFEN